MKIAPQKLLLLVVPALISCLSCGADVTSVKYIFDTAEVEDVSTTDENQFPDLKWEPPTPTPEGWQGNRYEIVPLFDISKPLNLIVGEHEPIKAKVIDFALLGPAPNYPVKFEVVQTNPQCDSAPPCGQFLVKNSFTNAEGIVSSTFEAGQQEEVSYTIRLSGPQADPVELELYVHKLPTGTLKIKFNYDGPISIHTINVRVSHASLSCANYNPVKPWVEKLDGQQTVSTVDNTPMFEELPLGQSYIVFATALGPTGHLAAGGCADAIHILPQEEGVTQVTLNLYVLTLNPAGTYDTVNHFDFTGAIPGQAGEIINMIVDLFYDPGKIVIDLIKEVVSQYIGEWVTDAAFSLFEDALADVITDWLLNNSPDFMQDFFTVGQDLVQIVKNVELTSTLKLSKLMNDFYFQGEQYWTGINLYWKLGCDPDAPDYEECGKHSFSLEDLQNAEFPIDLVKGQFTGMIANYDQLIIDTHKIELNYGKLILFVIDYMLLPAVSNYNSLEDLLYSIIDCQAIADGIAGDILDAIGIDKDKVKTACEQAVAFIVSPLEEVISGLALDSKLRIHGKCRMVDKDDDLFVDLLVEGKWWGHVEMGGEEGAEFKGDFEAQKAPYPGNQENQPGEPQPEQ